MNQQIPTKDPRIISYNALRKTIGWLGLSLPAAMVAGNYLFGHCNVIQDSNSQYYYTVTGNLLTGILCCVALFLIAYKGFDKTDNISTSLAGILALGVAFFPTDYNPLNTCAVIHLNPDKLRNIVHYGFAGLFLTTLACISLFLFVKSKGKKTNQKKKRNKVYRTCGIVMLVASALIPAYSFYSNHSDKLDKYKPTFWLEWIALAAFGISWLVKGEIVLKDKPINQNK